MDLAAVLVPEEVLEEDLHGVGQAGDVESTGQGVESVYLEVRSPTAMVARVEKLSAEVEAAAMGPILLRTDGLRHPGPGWACPAGLPV